MAKNGGNSINALMSWEDDPGPYQTGLIECCERACIKPLSQVTPSEAVALIRNNVALEHVVPHALSLLKKNPTVFGRNLDGDLFKAVLQVSKNYWENHEEEWGLAYALLREVEEAVEEIWSVKDAFVAEFHE